MQPRTPPAPRRRLNPELRAAAREAMAQGYHAYILSQIAGFPQPAQFSSALHAETVPDTPLMRERLARVAEAIKFFGPLFVEDEAAEVAL
jgi:hypothetical protein